MGEVSNWDLPGKGVYGCEVVDQGICLPYVLRTEIQN